MPLELMYITNDPHVAQIVERSGVDRIWIDLETLGKEERQKNMNTVKSHHTIQDVAVMSKVLRKAELMVRIDPWHTNSVEQIEQVIVAGADRIMLPMWKTTQEVQNFLEVVDGRVCTTLLLETKEAEECIDTVLELPGLNEIHIGLNDLHLSHGMSFMFELLADGTVEKLCNKFRTKGIAYGFGGIARIGEGTLPAERIVCEHYRLGSTRAIVSRSFCNTDEVGDLQKIERIFSENIRKLREYEASLEKLSLEDYWQNQQEVTKAVAHIVGVMKEKKKNG